MLWLEISAFHDGNPTPSRRDGRPSCHGHDDGDGAPRDRGVPCDPCGLHHDDACHDDHACHDGARDGRAHDDRLSCDRRPSSHGVRDGVRACDACLHHDGHRRSDGPCGSDPCDISCGNRRFFRLCRDVCDGHVCLLYGDVHVRDDGRDDRVHRGVSCGRRHVRDGVRGDDVFRGHRGRLCGDGDVPYVLYVPFLRVRGDGGHDVPCRLRTRGGGPCSLRGPGLGSGLSPDPRPPPDIPVLQLQPTSLLVEFVL